MTTSEGAAGEGADPSVPVRPGPPPATGVGAVDRALDHLQGLEQRPLTDRVAVLEHAHGALRRALDPDDGPVEEPIGHSERGPGDPSGPA